MKIEDLIPISLDILRFVNPLQANIGLEGDSLNGFLLIAIIIASIALFPFLRKFILNSGIVDDKGSYIVTFTLIFMMVGSMPQNDTVQPLALIFVLLFRFIDGYGLGEFMKFSHTNSIVPYIIGGFFSLFYGYLLFIALQSNLNSDNLQLLVAYLASFILEIVSLIGLCKLIFIQELKFKTALMLSIAACMLALSSFIGSYEYSHEIFELYILLAFPMGVLVNSLTNSRLTHS